MRYVSSWVSRVGVMRMMLVENPQAPSFRDGVLCFMYDGANDGPPVSAHFYEGFTVAQVVVELEETTGHDPSSWSPIPDQLAGCQDDWIGPVRAVRDDQGKVVHGQWEKNVDDRWVSFAT